MHEFEIGERIWVNSSHAKFAVMVVTSEWGKLAMSQMMASWGETTEKFLDHLISIESRAAAGRVDQVLCGLYDFTSPDGCFVSYRVGDKWYTDVLKEKRWQCRVVNFIREGKTA